MAIRIAPRPDYVYHDNTIHITPRPNYRPKTMHTETMHTSGMIRGIDVDWCPICHSSREHIEERMDSGRPKWHCRECGHVW